MQYFLSNFLFPIKQPITVSREVPIIFDNPRSKTEIEHVRTILTEHLKKHQWFKKRSSFNLNKEYLKKSLIKIESSNYVDSQYVVNYFQGYKDEDFFDFISKMWVIIRYEEDEEIEIYEKNFRALIASKGIVPIENPSRVYGNREASLNYCNLLSIFSQKIEDYIIGNNIIFEFELMPFQEIGTRLISDLMWFWLIRWSFDNSNSELDKRKFFPIGIQSIDGNSKKLDSLIERLGKDGKERLLYIGNLLLLSNDTYTKDFKIKILLLTSLLESLLTHNPDFSRYNVEDSISKQFQLKGSVLIHLNNKEMNIEQIKKDLNYIYKIRSSIIHGDFKKLEDIRKDYQKKEGKKLEFKEVVSNLYVFIKAILEEYIKNPSLVDFIKEN